MSRVSEIVRSNAFREAATVFAASLACCTVAQPVIKNALINEPSVADHANALAAHAEMLQPGDTAEVAAAVVIAEPGTIFRSSPATINYNNPESVQSNRITEVPGLSNGLEPANIALPAPEGTLSEPVALWRPIAAETMSYAGQKECYLGSIANAYGGSVWVQNDKTVNPGLHVYRRTVNGRLPEATQGVQLTSAIVPQGGFEFERPGQNPGDTMMLQPIESIADYTEKLQAMGFEEVDPTAFSPCEQPQ